jgi:hypothetical protein
MIFRRLRSRTVLTVTLFVSDPTNVATMQSTRESSRQKRSNKRRNSRKKSLSPSDLKLSDDKLNKRSLSEGSVKVKHRKSNIRRTLTHPFTCTDDIRDVTMIGVFNRDVKVDVVPQESDESNLPPTSSDRDTEDDGRVLRPPPPRPRWDSGSEMDSLVSTVVRRASARRRRTPANTGTILSIFLFILGISIAIIVFGLLFTI